MSETETPAPVWPLHTGLLTSRARSAARSGDLDLALRLLHDVRDRGAGEDRDVLDLLARVHAQRGELTRAAECWRHLGELHPRDPAAAAGLARIDRLSRRGPGSALARHRVRTALVCTVCAVTALTTGGALLAERLNDRPSSPGTEREPGAQRMARSLVGEHEAREARQRARTDARRTAEAEALAGALRLPGTRAQVRGHAVEVTFVDGLFSQGARLTPDGAAALAGLGERLPERAAHIGIHGHTASVSGAPRDGGSVTALWRALVAARELSAASGQPLTEFDTASADQSDAPYEAHALNRTVTVLVTP